MPLQDLLVEAVCQQKRQTDKLRQIEKAVFFIERRQDASASLPSEVGRHYHQIRACRQATSQNSLSE